MVSLLSKGTAHPRVFKTLLLKLNQLSDIKEVLATLMTVGSHPEPSLLVKNLKLLNFMVKTKSLVTGEFVEQTLASQTFIEFQQHCMNSQDQQVLMQFAKLLFLLHLKTPGT